MVGGGEQVCQTSSVDKGVEDGEEVRIEPSFQEVRGGSTPVPGTALKRRRKEGRREVRGGEREGGRDGTTYIDTRIGGGSGKRGKEIVV